MPNTHCLPSGSLAANELNPPNIPGIGQVQIASGGFGASGVRGLMVLGHGWNDNPANQGNIDHAFQNALVADGWAVLVVAYPEDYFHSDSLFNGQFASTGTANDVWNDAGFGARNLNTWLRTWDHVVWWAQNKLAKDHGGSVTTPTIPIVPFGVSWGGWHMTQVALNKSSTITAWGIHIPVVKPSSLIPLITSPYNWGSTAYSAGTTYAIAQSCTQNGHLYVNVVGSTGVAPTGAATSNATWTYYFDPVGSSPINTTGMDVTTLQGIGNGQGGVLPFSVVGWSNPDATAQSQQIQPYAATAAGGYYAGLMTQNGPLTEGHTFSACDTAYYTGFFTGTTSDSYSAGTAYTTGQMTTYSGFMYSSIAGSTGHAPSGTATSNAYWTYFSTPPWSSTFCVDHLCPKAF